MTMKKTDLYKNLAKQIDRQQKAAGTPQRFGAGAAAVAGKREKSAAAVAGKREKSAAAVAGKREKSAAAGGKLVPITCRLPAEMVTRLRERALETDGGLSAVVAQALAQWLAGNTGEAS